jgi:folate-binding protein YgfZ
MSTESLLSVENTFRALSEHIALFAQPDRAVVMVRGKDARVFLHRLSTQHVVDRVATSGVLNSFLDKKGRIRFLTHHVTLRDDVVLLVAGLGEGRALAEWLESFHFSEDLTIEDVSSSRTVSLLAGARALEVLAPFFGDAVELAPFDARANEEIVAVRTFDLRVEKNRTIPCVFVVDGVRGQSTFTAPHGAPEALECARIAALVPRATYEVTDAVNPLELALTHAIHWDKGCYTGQEVISRTENRGKQARYLVGLVVDASVSVGDEVKNGQEVLGTVTSVSPCGIAGLPRALSVFRTREDLDGRDVDVVGAHGTATARVVRASAPSVDVNPPSP